MSLQAPSALSHYLPEVAGHFDVVPGVVVKLSIHRLHNGLKGPRAQVNDQGDRTILQSQVDIISWLAGVQNEPVSLPGLEGEGDLITAALDGVLRQVVAQVLGAPESGHILLSGWRGKTKIKREKRTAVNRDESEVCKYQRENTPWPLAGSWNEAKHWPSVQLVLKHQEKQERRQLQNAHAT